MKKYFLDSDFGASTYDNAKSCLKGVLKVAARWKVIDHVPRAFAP